MIGQSSNIDRIFREGLSNFEATPPPEVWNEVRNSLTKKRKLPVFYSVAAASISVLILAGSAWLLFTRNPGTQTLTEQTIAGEEVPPQTLPADQETTSIDMQENEQPPVASPDPENAESITPDLQAKADVITMDSPKLAENLSENKTTDRSSGEEEPLSLLTASDPVDQPEYRLLEGESDLTIPNPILPAIRSGRAYGTLSSLEYPVDDFISELPGEIQRWSVGGQISPVYSFRIIGKSNPRSNEELYNNLEEGITTYAGGININYRSRQRLTVHTGIYYARMGQQISDIQLYMGVDGTPLSLPIKGNISVQNSIGAIKCTNEQLFLKDNSAYRVEPLSLIETYDPGKLPLIPMKADIIQSFEYLEIPLIIKYKFIDRKLDMHLLGGLSTNFIIGNEAYAIYADRKIAIGETTDIQPINYSSTLGIGFEYGLTDHISLSLEPSFKYYLNSINTKSNISTHPYSIGIFTGLSYYFK